LPSTARPWYAPGTMERWRKLKKADLFFQGELRGPADPNSPQTNRVRETWLEGPLGGGTWMVAYRVVLQGDRPVIAEVRVFPNEDGRKRRGQWSAQRLGDLAPVPAGGLPAHLLRKLKPGEALKLSKDKLGRLYDTWSRLYGTDGPELLAPSWGSASKDLDLRPGRSGRPEEFWAKIAEAYVSALQGGSRTPIRDLAEQFGCSPPRMRDLVFQARNKKFLTESTSGRSGGDLTHQARRVLGLKSQQGPRAKRVRKSTAEQEGRLKS
jgi:hypothetical protein